MAVLLQHVTAPKDTVTLLKPILFSVRLSCKEAEVSRCMVVIKENFIASQEPIVVFLL